MLLPMKSRPLACVAVLSCVLISSQAPADAQVVASRPIALISDNSGGNIAAFAATAASYRSSGTLVQIVGRCDSACTLFLGLPSRQLCVTPGAYFRFHAPSGVPAAAERVAQNYLMQKYPGWVRSWIGRKHGLTSQLITMDYNYAGQFLQTCPTLASR